MWAGVAQVFNLLYRRQSCLQKVCRKNSHLHIPILSLQVENLRYSRQECLRYSSPTPAVLTGFGPRFIWTITRLMSEGEIPEMREACPSVAG